MKLFGICPARKTGNGVELAEEAADQSLAIVLRAQLLESPEHTRERSIGIGDRAFRKIFALQRQAFTMSEKFLAIELRG